MCVDGNISETQKIYLKKSKNKMTETETGRDRDTERDRENKVIQQPVTAI